MNNDSETTTPAVKVKKRSGPRSRSSPYKGVTQYKRTQRWEAHIWIPNPRGRGFQRHLGSYYTAEDAARCFDRATIRVRGTDEELNFPLGDYDEDEFMLAHRSVEKFKFLDLLRAKFAIVSETPVRSSTSSSASHAAMQTARPRAPPPTLNPPPLRNRSRNSSNNRMTVQRLSRRFLHDEDEDEEDDYNEEDEEDEDYEQELARLRRRAPPGHQAPPPRSPLSQSPPSHQQQQQQQHRMWSHSPSTVTPPPPIDYSIIGIQHQQQHNNPSLGNLPTSVFNSVPLPPLFTHSTFPPTSAHTATDSSTFTFQPFLQHSPMPRSPRMMGEPADAFLGGAATDQTLFQLPPLMSPALPGAADHGHEEFLAGIRMLSSDHDMHHAHHQRDMQHVDLLEWRYGSPIP